MPFYGPSASLKQTSVKTADYTAVNKDLVLVDTNAASGDVTISLPASPSNGDTVGILLVTDHATRICDIDRNASNVNGAAANPTNYYLVLEGDYVEFQYSSGDSGWSIINDRITRHKCQMTRDAAQTGIPDATFEKILFDAEEYDVGGIGDEVTGDDFTIRRTGKYLITSSWAVAADVLIALDVYRDTGSGPATIDRHVSVHGDNTLGSAYDVLLSKIYELNAGDTIEMHVYHDNTGSSTADTLEATELKPKMMLAELRP